MKTFSKDVLSLDQQIDTLVGRGLVIEQENRVKRYLGDISYFRLSAYTKPFCIPAVTDADSHQFVPGTSFDDVLSLYIFDREVRLLLLDAIERLEVSLRAQLTQTLAMRHGAFGYLNRDIFDTRYNHDRLRDELKRKAGSRNLESFFESCRRKYPHSSDYPPIWMALELLSFGQISILFSNLRLPSDQGQISGHFGFPFVVLKSWFRSLSDLRNHCAHHARVWNREFGSCPVWPRKPPSQWAAVPERLAVPGHPEQAVSPRRRLYFQLVIVETLLQVVSPDSGWAVRLVALLDKNPNVSRVPMGFPSDWKEEPFWTRA
ncbi:MAG: Abi family protein [Kistimonas sp.]|nr:Abi family protein [Kistimonas sp.]